MALSPRKVADIFVSQYSYQHLLLKGLRPQGSREGLPAARVTHRRNGDARLRPRCNHFNGEVTISWYNWFSFYLCFGFGGLLTPKSGEGLQGLHQAPKGEGAPPEPGPTSWCCRPFRPNFTHGAGTEARVRSARGRAATGRQVPAHTPRPPGHHRATRPGGRAGGRGTEKAPLRAA